MTPRSSARPASGLCADDSLASVAHLERRLSTDCGARAYPRDPRLRIADLAQIGEEVRALPDLGQQLGTALALDPLNEPLALLVLLHLGVEADDLLQELGRPALLLAAVVERAVEAVAVGDEPGA